MTADAFRWRPEENLHPMDPRVNTQVRAANRAAEIIQRVWGFTAVEDGPWVKRADAAAVAGVLFDHARCPELAWKADAAAEDFHRIAAEDAQLRAIGERPILHYDTYDTEYNPNATHEQGVVRIWAVGTNHVDIVRDCWHYSPNRPQNTITYFASLLGLRREHDHRNCVVCAALGESHVHSCNVNLAKACGGTTRLMPVARDPLILLFRCCRECEALGGQIAANNYKTNVIEARADLPPGAVIMPNPGPDVNPDAWA